MGLPAAGVAARVAASRPRRFSPGSGEADTQEASNSMVGSRGEGWGYPYSALAERPKRTGRAFSAPSLLRFYAAHAAPRGLCHCALAAAAKTPISAMHQLRAAVEGRFALEAPQDPAQETPPERSAELPPDAPREPILTLPGALTAYVLLLAVIHLRVLLPPDSRTGPSTCSASFRSVTTRRCSMSPFPAAPAPRSGPSSPIRCCTPISAISVSTCCGCCRSAARWRAGSVRCASFCSWR